MHETCRPEANSTYNEETALKSQFELAILRRFELLFFGLDDICFPK